MSIQDPDDVTELETLISQAVDSIDTLIQERVALNPDPSAEVADVKAKVLALLQGFSEMIRVGQQGPD